VERTGTLEAALLAEWAGSQGKFWDFIKTYLREGSPTREGVFQVIRSIGLDERKARKLLENKQLQKPYAERIHKDVADAQTLEVTFTPTWFVRYPDGKVDRAFGGTATSLLKEEVIAKHSRKRE
jgi:predicted DsbA family dithiol-disulfide isomerase